MIEVHNLSKRYGTLEAVKNVSFSVGTGQVVGLLGPNGAGKTTIMKMLTCFHFPTQGTALVDGISVQDNPEEVKQRVGYLPESVPLYGDLTPDEYLRFVAQARLLDPKKQNERIHEVLSACGLQSVRSQRIETLSKGYKQRVGLAQAILHDPPILILDEPTTGLDPNQILEIRSLVRELGKSKTVILSTHILQEVEAVCTQVLIINEGRIAAQGTAEEIASTLKGGDTWELILKGVSSEQISPMVEQLGAQVSVNHVEKIGDEKISLRLFIPSNVESKTMNDGEGIFDWAVDHHIKILQMNRRRFSLEDIFVKLTTEGESK
jgi:ABC-2 type transport system ATP-binding protein